MQRTAILPDQLLLRPADIWLNQNFLLTAGNREDFNTMTVAWGSFGGMWARPFAQIVVRPGRYTFGFLEKYDTFSLSSFSAEYKKDVQHMGTRSGRDGDKLSGTKLTVCPGTTIDAPCFEEAELVIECRKMYWQDMNPAHFLYPDIEKKYPQKDYHRIYYGEILGAYGTKPQASTLKKSQS